MTEDSSFEGWTTDAPTGRKVAGAPAKNWLGEIRSLPRATDDAIKYASRTWVQSRPKDFDREGRVWTDRATGVAYRLVHGNPLLGDDPEQADLFVVEDDCILFLRRADARRSKSVSVGMVGGWQGR